MRTDSSTSSLLEGVEQRPSAVEVAEPANPKQLAFHFERYYRDLCRQAMSNVRSPQVAEDIVQQVFADAAAAIERGTNIENLGGWLRTSVYYSCVKSFRQKPSVSLDGDYPESEPDCAARTADLNLCWQEIYEAVEKLPNLQKTIFLMADVHGLSYDEIASELGRTRNVVGVLLNRARGSIRAEVGLERIPVFAPLIQAHFQALASRYTLSDRFVVKLNQAFHSLSPIINRSAETAMQLAQPNVVVAACAAVFAVCAGLPAPHPTLGALGGAGQSASLKALDFNQAPSSESKVGGHDPSEGQSASNLGRKRNPSADRGLSSTSRIEEKVRANINGDGERVNSTVGTYLGPGGASSSSPAHDTDLGPGGASSSRRIVTQNSGEQAVSTESENDRPWWGDRPPTVAAAGARRPPEPPNSGEQCSPGGSGHVCSIRAPDPDEVEPPNDRLDPEPQKPD